MPALPESLSERFWQHAVIPTPHPGACWGWLGPVNKTTGYAYLSIGGTKVYAHRLSHELFIGPIPDGHVVDHHCRVTFCPNPLHLEAVTNAENIRRGLALRTHCPHGHPYEGDNLFYDNGGRKCRACVNGRNRRRYERTHS